MACSKCKNQKRKKELLDEVAKVEKPIKIFIYGVLGLGIWGLVSLVKYIVNLFG